MESLSNIERDRQTAGGVAPSSTWDGLTLEQLRFRRGMALVRREVGRERVNGVIASLKADVQQNGVRSLMFKPGTVKALRWTDYLLLGFNVFKTVRRLWRRK